LLANNNLEQLNWSRLPLGSVDPQQLGACALNFRGDPHPSTPSTSVLRSASAKYF